jgi:hypothetical protein
MTPITAAMAIAVVIADISIKSRTFASASGGSSGAGSSDLLISDFWAKTVTMQICHHD